MEAVLDEEVHASLPPAANPDDLATPPDTIIETTQARLGQIQLALRGDKRSIEDDKRQRTGLFIALYAVGSIIVLAGTAVSAAGPRVVEG